MSAAEREPAPEEITMCVRWSVPILGLCASALVAVGGFGVGAVPEQLQDTWLHTASSGRLAATLLCAAGVLLLLGCWWRLRGSSPRELLTASALWSVPLLLTPPLFSRDLYAYAGQAHLLDAGLDPYTHGPMDAPGALASEVDSVWAATPSPYGPVFLRLAALLVPGQHVIAAVLLLRLLAVVGLILLAWALLQLAENQSRALWLVVANPIVLLHGIGGGHNEMLMAGLLLAGLAVVVRRPGLAGLMGGAALVTAAALIKVPAVVALAFLPLLHKRRIRAAAVVGVTTAVTGVALTLASGLGVGWLGTLGGGEARRSLLSVSTGTGVLAGNLFGAGAVTAVRLAGLLLASLLVVGLLWRAARIGVLRALGLALLVVAVLGPVVQPWYLLWSLPVLACTAGPRLARSLAVGSAVLCLLILPSGRHLIRPPLYGVPMVLVLAAGYAAARGTRSADSVATT